MSQKILILVAVFAFSSLTTAQPFSTLIFANYDQFPNSLKGKDFFIKKNINPYAFKSQKISNEPSLSCRDQIKKVICLVEPNQPGQDPQRRPCLDGGLSYATYFEDLYDHYSPPLQKMFCSINHIFIEKKFFGTAYAAPLIGLNGEMTGVMLGIRQSILDQNLSLSTWASWKEQLSFGGRSDSYTVQDNLPKIQTSSSSQSNELVYFVISHELGHIFDFANHVNQTQKCRPNGTSSESEECDLAPNSWGAISWQTTLKPKPEYEFNNRSGLCFYDCQTLSLGPDDVPHIYADLSQTNFISTYATTQPWDDFADSFAYYLMTKNLNLSYIISTQQGYSYDIIQKLKSPIFVEKYGFIENFLNRSDLFYP